MVRSDEGRAEERDQNVARRRIAQELGRDHDQDLDRGHCDGVPGLVVLVSDEFALANERYERKR